MQLRDVLVWVEVLCAYQWVVFEVVGGDHDRVGVDLGWCFVLVVAYAMDDFVFDDQFVDWC